MATTYSNLRTQAATVLQDSSSAVYSTGELDYAITDALRLFSTYSPNLVRESFTIEGRTGTATTTTASALVDSKAQFLSTDTNKVIFNSTDKTWAIVTAYVSASQLTLSKDIMVSGESYEMYNKGCVSNKQINIEDTIDYLEAIKAEYPIGYHTPYYRNVSVDGDILTLEMDRTPDDTSQSTASKEVYVYFNKRHKLSQLTDLLGAVKGDTAAGATSITIDGLQATGTVEADQEFTIAGTRGTYRATAAGTISTNEVTLTITPALESAVADNAVVTFKLSTLKPRHEPILVEMIAGQAAVNKAGKFHLEVNSALTQTTNSATAISAVAARITQATTDIAAGKTEHDKTVAIVLEANTAIDNMSARITQAITDIGSGRTEAAKIAALITAAGTPLGLVAARLSQAVTDISSGRTAAGKIDALITSANTEIQLINPQIDLAVTALSSGNSLLNTVPLGGGAPEYMNQAATDLATARGYFSSASGYLTQAASDANANNEYLNLASKEISEGLANIQSCIGFLNEASAEGRASDTYQTVALRELTTANQYLSQAHGYLAQVRTDEDISSHYVELARAELESANTKIRESNSNLSLVASRIQVSGAGRYLQAWGESKIEKAKNELRRMAGYPTSQVYSRD